MTSSESTDSSIEFAVDKYFGDVLRNHFGDDAGMLYVSDVLVDETSKDDSLAQEVSDDIDACTEYRLTLTIESDDPDSGIDAVSEREWRNLLHKALAAMDEDDVRIDSAGVDIVDMNE